MLLCAYRAVVLFSPLALAAAADEAQPPPDPVASLAAALAANDRDAVRNLIIGHAPAGAPATWPAIAAMARRILDWQSAVRDSFQEDIGKRVMVVSPTGAFAATVTGVNASEVRLRVFAKKGFEEQTLSFVTLTAAERERRLVGYTDAEKAIIAALSAVRSDLFDEAGEILAKIDGGPLAAALAATVAGTHAQALEREAEQALRQMLDGAGFGAEQVPDDSLLLAVQAKQFGARLAPALRAQALAFTNRFSATQVGMAWARIVGAFCTAGTSSGPVDDADVTAAIAELKKKNPAEGNLQAGHIIHDGKVELDLSGNAKLKDIAPLEKIRICDLDLTGTGVRSLAALRSMPLERLILDGAPLQSLHGIEGCPVRTLSLTNAAVTDIRAIRGAPLESVNLYRSKIKSLAGLEGAPLKDLIVAETLVSDLKPLTGAPLTNFNANACPAIVDLRPLAGAPLESLYLWGASVSDFRPLARMPLKILHCTLISDLSVLAETPLEWLIISSSPVSDLRPLAKKPIAMLSFTYCPEIQDLSPLRGMPLTSLDLTGCPKVNDLSPLRGMPLTALLLDGTAVDDNDMAVIGDGLPDLGTLFLSGCKKVNDLKFLLSLKSLSAVSLPPGINALRVLEKHAAIAVVYENGIAIPVKEYIASRGGRAAK